MKLAMFAATQHLPAAAVRDAVARPWNDCVTNGSTVAAHTGAALGATTRPATGGVAVAPASYKRTAQFLIRDSSPPV